MDSRKPATVSRGHSWERGGQEEPGRIVWREGGGRGSTRLVCRLHSLHRDVDEEK